MTPAIYLETKAILFNLLVITTGANVYMAIYSHMTLLHNFGSVHAIEMEIPLFDSV